MIALGANKSCSLLPGALRVLAVILTAKAATAAARELPGDDNCYPTGGCGHMLDLNFRCDPADDKCQKALAQARESCCETLYEMRFDKCATCRYLQRYFGDFGYGRVFDPKTCTNGVGYAAAWCEANFA